MILVALVFNFKYHIPQPIYFCKTIVLVLRYGMESFINRIYHINKFLQCATILLDLLLSCFSFTAASWATDQLNTLHTMVHKL